jgi:hypothetical protein
LAKQIANVHKTGNVEQLNVVLLLQIKLLSTISLVATHYIVAEQILVLMVNNHLFTIALKHKIKLVAQRQYILRGGSLKNL